MTSIDTIKTFLLAYQRQLCDALAALDGQKVFHTDAWQRTAGGGGVSCVLEQGTLIEKAGVNFSHITGETLPASASQLRQDFRDAHFEALGVSVVIHPWNPYIPTSHCNVRYFHVEKESGESLAWFGGGFDLTPFYGFDDDCILWHQHAKAACAPFGPEVYPKFKQNCDDYFILKHRNEARGIGGIFFDDLHDWGMEAGFAFIQAVAQHYQQAYLEIIARRRNTPYTQRERDFQLYRRGRYTEFNLLYDRGTLFGLQSGGRTESILISLPPLSSTCYNYSPVTDSPEAELYQRFLPPKNWLE